MSNVKRFFLWPVLQVIRMLRKWIFQFTSDARYLKTLRNKHAGERCFIVGNGPSLTTEDLETIPGEITFGTNRIFHIFDQTTWRPTYFVSIDMDILRDNWKTISALDLPNLFINIMVKTFSRIKKKNIHYISIYGTDVVDISTFRKDSISEDVSKYFSRNYTVTCVALEMAIYMGFKEIYLIGCDHHFSRTVRTGNVLQEDKNVVNYFNNTPMKAYAPFYVDAVNSCYEAYENYAQAHGIQIFNATRGGKLEIFRRVDFDALMGKQ